MTTRRKYKTRSFVNLITVTVIIFLTLPTQATELNKKNNVIAQILFSHTKPQCIGRYLIDVPESFNNILKDMVFIDEFKIESQRLYRPSFEQRIKLREQELYNPIQNKKGKSKYPASLKEVIHLPDANGVIFDYNEFGTPDTYRKLEAHIYSGMTAFMITTEINDYSDPKNKERKDEYLSAGFTEAETNTKPATLSAMKSLISRLSGRKDDEIPVDKGVCIPDGFIKDNSEKQKEKVTFSFGNPDFIFGMYMNNTYVGSSSTLLSRGEAIKEEQEKAHYHTVKYGELQPGGIPAQEWLSAGMQESNSIKGKFPAYDFTLYANETIASPTKPWLSVEFGNTDKLSKYSESQMVEIWDRLVSSLRYHPNAY
ncbi:T6SS immunity protein Tli4 family protein [Buttiauxella massiliensis]|uniref:T6SS immunity protein Tli4 family protein n=1 Tax=Buttiauxella massiliensis TaxID=2831590 RepID=UPI001869ADBE|nr:T6SS immunity protein Tli4 family protein [Buttiauxella massiliensis]